MPKASLVLFPSGFTLVIIFSLRTGFPSNLWTLPFRIRGKVLEDSATCEVCSIDDSGLGVFEGKYSMPRQGSVFVWVKFDWHCILGVHIRLAGSFFFNAEVCPFCWFNSVITNPLCKDWLNILFKSLRVLGELYQSTHGVFFGESSL